MTQSASPSADVATLRQRALSRWDNEGGALPPNPILTPADIPTLGNAELVQLRIRVIALENLVIALLSQGTDDQLNMAGEMAAYIAPRPDFTQHPLTANAAQQMNELVARAFHFRDMSVP